MFFLFKMECKSNKNRYLVDWKEVPEKLAME